VIEEEWIKQEAGWCCGSCEHWIRSNIVVRKLILLARVSG
jgi:hypothetical protein